jgi:hypothetical protein
MKHVEESDHDREHDGDTLELARAQLKAGSFGTVSTHRSSVRSSGYKTIPIVGEATSSLLGQREHVVEE